MEQNAKNIRVSWTKGEKKIFGAFQWNAYVIAMYEDVFQKISNKYGWGVQYGAKHILKTDVDWDGAIKTKDVKEFINRNKQLYDIFVEGISSCDLFIADITNHNPNVMLELGVAIQLNKNILIVTNQNIDELPFDIRGLEAKVYHSREELLSLIEKEIEIYHLIKEQRFEPEKSIIQYQSKTEGVVRNKDAIKVEGIPKLKNLRIKVDFKFIYSINQKWDWFGIHLRAQGPSRFSSELILVRYAGKTRSLTWPEQRKENDGKLITDFNAEAWHTLEVLINENKLTAWINSQLAIEDSSLIIENFGEVFISCNDHHESVFFDNKKEGEKNQDGNYLEIEYKNVEILDLNTTASLFL